jgi:tetratricopeptide (TPR) repeat protein
MAEGSIVQADFFISRAGENAAVAIEIAEILHKAGHTTFIQDKDFGHTDFMTKMGDAFGMVDRGARVIAVLSHHYLHKDYCLKEAHHPLIGDPGNRKERLIVLRVSDCEPAGFLKAIPYVDLVPLLLDAEGFARAVLSAVAPRGRELPAKPGAQVLHPEIRPVPGFTGREAELAAIEAALWEKGGTAALTNVAASAAVKGLGGVGKSVLAQEYAWRNRGRYQGVWWIRAEKSETMLGDLVELGARFIPGIREVPDRAQAAHAALAYIANMRAGKPWLLVYDNVEQPGDIDRLTPTEGAHVLITTRWSDWRGQAAAPVKVGVFAPDVAAQFLLESTSRADRAGAEKLAAALGYLPLALDHASVYCRRTGLAFETYAAPASDLIRKVPRGPDYEDEAPVFATFELAISKVAEACPEAEKLMGICAFLAPERIPLDIVTADVMSEIERGEAVAALQEVSLVTLEPLDDGSAGISVHRLVQEEMRGRLQAEEGEFAATAALATRLVADAFPSDPHDVRHWPACARLMPHTMAVFRFAPDEGDDSERTSQLLNCTALNNVARAAFSQAEPLYERALAIDEARLGPEHPIVATLLNNLAHLLRVTNRPTEAEPLMRRALAIGEASLGPDHPNVATSLSNLAVLREEAFGDFVESEKLKRRALAILEKSFGSNHPQVAVLVNNLAQLLKATNRVGEAEPLMRRALAIDEASFGPVHPNVARDLSNLGSLLSATNRVGEAEPLMRRALAIDEASFGPDHPDVAIDLNNLGSLLRATNRAAQAEPLMRRALAIAEASFGPDHPDVAVRLNNLAGLLAATNRAGEAEPLMRRSVGIKMRSLGPDHPSTKLGVDNLAALEADLRAAAADAAVLPAAQVRPARPEALRPSATATGAKAKRGWLPRWLGGR